MGINPDTFFGKLVYTGSHENAVIALGQGTVDVAANRWNDEQESMLMRMDRKGMAKYSDYRIIFKSDQIVNSPIATLTDMPADLRKLIRDAVFAFADKDPEGFKKMTDGKQQNFAPTSHKDFEPIVDLNKFVDQLRKKSS
jgi:phosphonate transport system substrate-binding protein